MQAQSSLTSPHLQVQVRLRLPGRQPEGHVQLDVRVRERPRARLIRRQARQVQPHQGQAQARLRGGTGRAPPSQDPNVACIMDPMMWRRARVAGTCLQHVR